MIIKLVQENKFEHKGCEMYLTKFTKTYVHFLNTHVIETLHKNTLIK